MLLSIPHCQQEQQADCLAACAAMMFQYLHIPFDYNRLRGRLGTTEGGAAFERLEALKSLGLSVVIRHNDDLRLLLTHLEIWLPIIVGYCWRIRQQYLVAVETWALPYWQSRPELADDEKDTDHAVVIVGLDDDIIFLNDPSFAEAPQAVPVDAFLAAWSGFAYLHVVIGLVEVE